MRYVIEYSGPGSEGQRPKYQGWLVFLLTYAKSHMGHPIKREVQHPYRRLVAKFPSQELAEHYVASKAGDA